jgi:hypothetical protein
MAKSASLSSALVAKKGAAVPATVATEINNTEQPDNSTKKTDKEYYKALTVKLDKERFYKLKNTGLIQDKSSQDIFVEALDAYLNKT